MDNLKDRPANLKIRAWMVAIAICLIYLLAVFIAHDGDPLTFIYLSQPPSEQNPEGIEGYDGERVYYIAVDPAASPDYLDVPAYRLQRILLPMLARLLALGDRHLIPWTILIINLGALGGGVYLLERLLEAEGTSRWYALAYGLSAGIIMSVRLSMTEPLAFGLAILGIWLERRGKPVLMGWVFALAALAKEPALLFAAGYVLWMLLERRWWPAVRLGLQSGIPFVAWQIALYLWLGQFGVGTGGVDSTPFEIIPYNGYWRILTDTGNWQVFLAFSLFLLPVAVIPSIWGVIMTLIDLIRRHWHPYVLVLLLNAAVVATIPFSTFREPLGIVRIIPALIVCFLIYAAHEKQRRMLLFSVVWIATGMLAVTGG